MTCEVNYQLLGPPDAPVLVLMCSLGTDLSMWDSHAGELSGRFRVLRFDTRGHGDSPVPKGPYTIDELGGDLLALLDRLGIEQAFLCGVSLGGMTGLWTAANAPERVQRLIAICTSALPDVNSIYRERAASVRAHGVEPIADAVVGRWFTPPFFDEQPELVAQMRRHLVATPAEGYAACCEALAAIDLRASLTAITAPTLVISGADDLALPSDHGRAIADGIRGARFEVVPRSAHLANLEQPGLVGELILGHLA